MSQGGGARITATRQFALIANAFTALPDRFRVEFVTALKRFAPELLAHERAGVPTRSGPRPDKFAASRKGRRPPGGLVSLLSTNVDEGNLRLTGGLLTPQARADGFYGYILDAGRGLNGSRSKPKSRATSGLVAGRFGPTYRFSKPYSRAISPIAPGRYDIAFGRVRTWAREQMGPILSSIADRALRAIAGGDT
ncbi:MAG: hypothetical protein ACRYG4_04135 [Janthinobacterium lividum]